MRVTSPLHRPVETAAESGQSSLRYMSNINAVKDHWNNADCKPHSLSAIGKSSTLCACW